MYMRITIPLKGYERVIVKSDFQGMERDMQENVTKLEVQLCSYSNILTSAETRVQYQI